MKLLLSALIAAALLAGCASTTFDLKDDAQFQQTIPRCETDAECDKIWNAAREWVNNTTSQGLAVDTDQRLQTHPADAEALDWETDITVNKVAIGEGQYQIVIETLCNPGMNNCGAERNRMRAFNEAMAAYVSREQSAKTQRIIRQGVDMGALFADYAAAFTASNLQPLVAQHYLPTLVINGSGDVRQLRTADDVLSFLKGIQAQLAENDITRVAAQNPQVLTSNRATAIMKLQWAFFDASDDLQYTQKAIYNLIRAGKGWKIITISFDD